MRNTNIMKDKQKKYRLELGEKPPSNPMLTQR